MKSKDLIYLSAAIVLFVVTGVLGYSQLGLGKSTFGHEAKVEVVDPISAELDQEALSTLIDSTKARDFAPSIDLSSGLGNPKPFNPL